jgi:DNA polymerase sigma
VRVLSRPRVPLVKFTDSVSSLCCDICYENRLAIYNTQLLEVYSMIDHRVRPLIFVIKHWAKSRKINEAASGTLSR